jgi:hypothetical protein
MAIKLEDKPRVDAPDSDYPYGKIRDKTPTEGGTPINTEVYGDFHQFFAKMLAESGVVANGLPDNAYSGFQYFEAFINLLNSQVGKQLVLSMIGTYTTNDLVILHGCEVTANIPGTSEITAGAIYYNGEIYIVDANDSISSPSNTLVFIVKSETPNIIELVNGAPGSGIANYDGATYYSSLRFSKAIGEIIMYSGVLTDFDGTGLGLGKFRGFALCNGNNGTLDLRSRFIIGYDPTNSANDTIGETGGNNTSTIILGSRQAEFIEFGSGASNQTVLLAAGTDFDVTFRGVTSGSGIGMRATNDNRPAFITLAFIQRIS